MALAFLQSFCTGLQHALGFHKTVPLFVKCKLIRSLSLQCLHTNGLIFLGSILFMNYLLLPLLVAVPAWLGWSVVESDGTSLLDWVVFAFFEVLWLYPVYTLSLVLNQTWYQDIAVAAYEYLEIRAGELEWQAVLRDQIYRLLMGLALVVQCMLPYLLLPYVGIGISFVYTCFLYSFYCFEYKWGMDGLTLRDQLAFVEERWPYFLGFGTPATAATFFFPRFIGFGIFAMIFPIVRRAKSA